METTGKHTIPPKGPTHVEPNASSVRLCDLARHKLKHGVFNVSPVTNREDDYEEPSSRHVTRWLMSALAPSRPPAPPKLSNDLEVLKKAVSSIAAAADAEVLTEEEADAVIRFIAERFAMRRFDEVISRVTSPQHGAWFALHGHLESE